VFVTAWHMLVGLAAVRPGQTCWYGCELGVGIAAIQIAKLFHCRDHHCGRRSKNRERSALGADHGINHYKQKIPKKFGRLPTKKASTSWSSTSARPPGTKRAIPQKRAASW